MQKAALFSIIAYILSGVLFFISPLIESDIFPMVLKCTMIPCLISYFIFRRTGQFHKEDKYIITGLLFSWTGDILLQIRNGGDWLFLAGLIAFLCTHIFYTIVFFGTEGEYKFLRAKKSLIVLIIVYGALSMYIILPGIGNMQIPVTIYGIIITGMVLAALSRFGKVNETSYILVFMGALLFIISDSLIAFSKFKQAFPCSALIIMLTYLLAQFLIVEGLIKQYKKKE